MSREDDDTGEANTYTNMDTKKSPEIRREYVPSEEEMQAIRKVYQRKQEMGDARQAEEMKWANDIKQWEANREVKGPDDWKSNIYIPITSAIIEAQLSELVNQDLMPFVVPRGSEDEAKAKVMNSILEYTWDVAKSDVALGDLIKDALIFGTGIGQEYYLRQPKKIRTQGKGGKITERTVIEYDDCYLEPVKLEDFYIDERARGFSGPFAAVDCVRRYIMDIRDFKNYFTGDWDPLGNAKYVKPGGNVDYYEFYRPPERLNHEHEVEVLWYWNRVEDECIVVANDVCVVNGPNKYKHKQLPFVRVIDVKRPYQFYGKGQARLLESLQEETNTLRRMIIDRNHLDIDKPILVSDTFTIDDEDVASRPHGLIPVGDVNSARPLEYSDIPASTFKSLEMLRDDTIRVTGMDERQQSVSAAGTATEAAILKEATLKRLGMKILQIKQDTLVDIGRLRVANIMQFYPQGRLESIIGEERVNKAKEEGTLVEKDGQMYEKKPRTIRLEDQALSVNSATNEPMMNPTKGMTFFDAKPEFFMPTHGGYDIRYKSSSALPISKPLEMQKADEMYDRLSRNPAVDQWKLASYLIKSRDQNPDDFSREAQAPNAPPVNAQKMVDLAGMENSEMMEGKAIGPTPYASPIHTQMHVEFMKSPKFKEDLPEENTEAVLKIFSDHVMGEIAAQQARGGQGGPQDPASTAPDGGGMPSMPVEGQNPQDGVVQGGGDVPSGMDGANAGFAAR